MDLISWLESQDQYPKVYWQNRSADFAFAGCGAARSIETQDPAEVTHKLNELSALSYKFPEKIFIGGVAFDIGRSAAGRPLIQFIEPKVTQTSTKPKIARLNQSLPKVTSRLDQPTETDFTDKLNLALGQIRNGNLQKLVLARETKLELTQQLAPLDLIRALSFEAPRCSLFAFIEAPGSGFVSASPERLLSIREGRLFTDVLGGSMPRSSDPAADRMIASSMLKNPQLLREHLVIQDFLRQTLARLTYSPQVSEIKVLGLKSIHHLASEVSGKLRKVDDLTQILASLHPTPAVSGFPQQQALQVLREIDGWDRGWYAGALGLLSSEYTELAVGIRSASVQGMQVSAYAGVGIIEGAQAQDEWREMEAKLAPILKILSYEEVSSRKESF